MRYKKYWWLKFINHAEYIAIRDKDLFNSWETGDLETLEVIEGFKINNNITDEIDRNEFCRWLNSLGYLRK